MIIFDLEGTLADSSHRVHHIQKKPKDWDAFHGSTLLDPPIPATIFLMKTLRYTKRVEIWTGRSDVARNDTIRWMGRQGLHNACLSRMRKHGDHTPDNILKERWLDEELAKGTEIEMVFEDRSRVVDMWRRRGIQCFQVAEGNF